MQLRNRNIPSFYDTSVTYKNHNEEQYDSIFLNLKKVNEINYQNDLILIEKQQNQIIKKLNEIKNAIR
jgi:hypothetical protein